MVYSECAEPSRPGAPSPEHAAFGSHLALTLSLNRSHFESSNSLSTVPSQRHFQPAIWMIGKLQPCCTILCDINVIAIKPTRRNPRKQRCVSAALSLLCPQKWSSSGRAAQGKGFPVSWRGCRSVGAAQSPGLAGISAPGRDFQKRENCSG